jgi:hypothetical protein
VPVHNLNASPLPEIPVHDIGTAGAAELVRRARPEAGALLVAGRRQFTRVGMAIADRQGRRWLARSANPYAAEIDAIAAELGIRGAHALNLSYEWGCTSGVGPDPASAGVRLLRSLDWPFDGLGCHLVVARHESPPGAWLNVTWPGLVGVYTGLAPGRFGAAINQPPLRRRVGLLPADWLIDRIGVWRSRALPPSHLLRRVFETCATYAEARAALVATPICLPAFFSLSGMGAGQGCIIERTESSSEVHEAPAAIANDWLSSRFGRGCARGSDNAARRALMHAHLADDGHLDWVVPPIANSYTRLVLAANAATGTLVLQGWEADGPVTRVLRLTGAGCADADAAPEGSTGTPRMATHALQ